MDEFHRKFQKPTDVIPLDTSRKRIWITIICGVYLVLAGIFSTTTLDTDEFSFAREPYEILGR